jgi:hypothetical protein
VSRHRPSRKRLRAARGLTNVRHRHNGLPRWLRQTIYVVTTLLALTGIGWLVVVYALAPVGEPTPAPHPLSGPLLMWHGIAAYAGIGLVGLVGQAHLRTGWRTPALRPLGVLLCAALVLLIATGLGFYYGGNDALLPWLRWSHVALGVLMPVALAWHIKRGRRVK